MVVPTRDRPDALARCLRALEAQVRAPELVVVVDDGSQAADDVAAVVAASPRARLVRAEGDGPAAARNRGAAAADGCDLIAFTDDDCVPSAGWLAALVRVADAGADAVAGPTHCAPGASAADRAAQTITNHLLDESRGAGRDHRRLRADLQPGRAGCCPRRRVVRRGLPAGGRRRSRLVRAARRLRDGPSATRRAHSSSTGLA